LREALGMIGSGYFSPTDPYCYLPIITALDQGGDHYRLIADYESYISCQEKVDETYRDREAWSRMAILNVARMGKFSSDRTIAQYASEIWKVEPVSK
jgi:starch phosphorylase